jgi:hypothetical protein
LFSQHFLKFVDAVFVKTILFGVLAQNDVERILRRPAKSSMR